MELMPHTQSLAGRGKTRSEWNCYAIFDCPQCKQADMPLGIYSMSNGEEYITNYWCLNCKQTFQERPEITGWCSLLDLEECEWDHEL